MKEHDDTPSNTRGSETKKRWNAVVVSMDGKGPQRGLMHHLRNRKKELIEACRVWPDLLLKATCTAACSKDEPVFAQFLEELDDDCLVNAYGKVGLDARYEHIWEKARDAMAGSNLAELMFRFCRFNKSEALLELIKAFLSKPHDEIWRCVQKGLESSDGKIREKALDIINNLVQTFVAFDECPTAYFYGDTEWHLDPEDLEDPRRPLVLSFYPWAFTDDELGDFFIRRVAKSLNKIAVSERLDLLFEQKAAEEGAIRRAISEMWRELPEKMGRWIVGDGLTEVEMDFGDDTERFGLQLLTIHPEDKRFPALDIKTKWFVAGVYFEEIITISGDGQINLFDWRRKPGMTESQQRTADRARGLRLVIYYACAKVIYDYACSLGQDRQRKRKKTKDQVARTNTDGEKKIAISPHFPHIGRRGKNPTTPNVERCQRLYGYEPPSGRTLQMTPPLRGRQTKEDYEPIVLGASIEDI